VTLARAAAALGKPIIVAATGHSAEQLEELRRCGERCALLLASNTSLGVLAMQEISAHAQRILGREFEVEIMEIHHRNKKDAPSGTALSLAENLGAGTDLKRVSDRSARSARRGADEIGVTSLRGGDVAGEHTIYFFGEAEMLEITHRVTSREVFARGALNLAARLIEMKPGFYRPADLFR
jgi:4-hydroxy-tetrahydrodipicolinate reductase